MLRVTNFSGCPVCSSGVYTDPAAPISTVGSPNPAMHSCVKTGTWRDRTRFGGSVANLRSRLLETPDEALVGWPKVAALKVIAQKGGSLT
jgi:hypothetical protein